MIRRWCPLIVIAWFLAGSTPDARADLGDKWDPATMSIQGASSLVTMTGIGVLVGYATFDDKCEGWACLDFTPIILGALAGLAADVATTQLLGDVFDGSGTWTGTTAGMGVGFAAGCLGEYVLYKIDDDAHPAIVITTLFLPIVAGTVIGYHLSADEPIAAVPLLGGSF